MAPSWRERRGGTRSGGVPEGAGVRSRAVVGRASRSAGALPADSGLRHAARRSDPARAESGALRGQMGKEVVAYARRHAASVQTDVHVWRLQECKCGHIPICQANLHCCGGSDTLKAVESTYIGYGVQWDQKRPHRRLLRCIDEETRAGNTNNGQHNLGDVKESIPPDWTEIHRSRRQVQSVARSSHGVSKKYPIRALDGFARRYNTSNVEVFVHPPPTILLCGVIVLAKSVPESAHDHPPSPELPVSLRVNAKRAAGYPDGLRRNLPVQALTPRTGPTNRFAESGSPNGLS